MKQLALALTGFEGHGQTTHKAEFLSRLGKLVTRAEFYEVIEPHYPKTGNGLPPIGLERMLRMYFITNCFNLTHEVCDDKLYDIPSFQDFCRIDLWREYMPDVTSLLNFRYLLDVHQFGAALSAKASRLLMSNGLKLSGGTVVDSTIIAAPSSTKSADGKRARLYSDSAYANQNETIKDAAPKVSDFTSRRAYFNQPLSDKDRLPTTGSHRFWPRQSIRSVCSRVFPDLPSYVTACC